MQSNIAEMDYVWVIQKSNANMPKYFYWLICELSSFNNFKGLYLGSWLNSCVCISCRGSPSSRTLWNAWRMGYGTNSAASAGSVCPLKRWFSSFRESVISNTTCALLLRRTWLLWWRWSISKISFPKGKWLVRIVCLKSILFLVPSLLFLSSYPPCIHLPVWASSILP